MKPRMVLVPLAWLIVAGLTIKTGTEEEGGYAIALYIIAAIMALMAPFAAYIQYRRARQLRAQPESAEPS